MRSSQPDSMRAALRSRSAGLTSRSAYSPVALAHDEVQTAQHSGHVANHATGKKLGKDAEVDKRRRANFQAIRHAATLAVDVKAQLTLGIFRCEINFARRRIESFCHYDEMMDQLFHLRHDSRFWGLMVFQSAALIRPLGNLLITWRRMRTLRRHSF